MINNNPLRLIERGKRLFIDRRRECRNSIVAMFYAFEGSWNASFPRRSNGIAETVYWIVKGIKSMGWNRKKATVFFFFFTRDENPQLVASSSASWLNVGSVPLVFIRNDLLLI